ncbi:MAG: HAD family phosphatase [Isosphaeraceae bacterium]|nr:HAD family phosphatase [Isosphaeraceae bacterium]
MQRPAIIFDFGNVVAHFDYRRACERYGQRLGITGDAFLERLRDLGFSDIVQRYERGALSSRQFAQAVCSLIGLEISYEDFAASWSDIFWLNEPVARLIGLLKRGGYTLVLGSNTNDLHAAQFRQQFAETLSHFDRLVLSYEVGHSKPSADFYHACAAAAGCSPAGCVFIDDLAENVAGAVAAGLRGIQYRDVSSLVPELRALGVDIPESPAP